MARSLAFCFAAALIAGCGGSASDPSHSSGFANDTLARAAVPQALTPQSGATPWAEDRVVSDAQSACTGYPSVAENLLSDGDISQAASPQGNPITTWTSGQSFAPGWTVTRNSIDIYNGQYLKSPDGICTIDMDGSPGPGAIVHDNFPTEIGAQYTVAFLLSGNGECGGANPMKHLTVQALNASATYTWNTANGTAAKGDFQRESFTFKAKRNQANLRLTSTDPEGSDCGPVVGAISVYRS